MTEIQTRPYRLGVDVGGTFTDFVLVDDKEDTVQFFKTLTTYPDPSEGVIRGFAQLLARVGIRADAIAILVHGTTLVTNAIIERKGAKTALITTKGFRDVLEIGRELRYDIYDLFIEMPEPLVPRQFRFDVPERVDKDGTLLVPLDRCELETILTALDQKGVEAVAICFLHSFRNPQNEQEAAGYTRSRSPHLFVSVSSEVLPEIREYERMQATVMNAYVQPVAEQYLSRLERRLNSDGFRGALHMMVSSGRRTTVQQAKATPIHLLESGPAGGSMAGVYYSRLIGQPDLLTFDMGGTTAKASIIRNGQADITSRFEAARVSRFRKGSGLPVQIPSIDMIEIGAGGGSIAHLDALGLLRVGPQSAGADPGPACYGRGGQHATVTDADLLLGYLAPTYFLGGEMTLDVAAAERAIKQDVALPLGIDPIQAALGIHRIVNENMVNAVRVHILEKGLDPRQFTMMAFGGAGPVHAFQIARLLKIPRILIPFGAGIASALGFLVSPVAIESVRSYLCALDEVEWDTVNELLDQMERSGKAFLNQAGIAEEAITISRSADMRYSGQGHEIKVSIPLGKLDEKAACQIQENFLERYRTLYGRTIDGVVMESVSWRVVASGPAPSITFQEVEGSRIRKAPLKGSRLVYLPELDAFHECPVYDRYLMRAGEGYDGPAVIEERESTIIVGAGGRITIDPYLNAIIDVPV